MRVSNIHERSFDAPAGAVGALIDTLSGPGDRLWPRDRWPAMRFDRVLCVGAVGGHGPIRYSVAAYTPGRHILFRFSAPRGFDGTHGFDLVTAPDGRAMLRHALLMHAHGPALLSWPLVFRPLHDALIEDSLDRAALSLGEAPRLARWSARVRLLRGLAALPGRDNPPREAPISARTEPSARR